MGSGIVKTWAETQGLSPLPPRHRVSHSRGTGVRNCEGKFRWVVHGDDPSSTQRSQTSGKKIKINQMNLLKLFCFQSQRQTFEEFSYSKWYLDKYILEIFKSQLSNSYNVLFNLSILLNNIFKEFFLEKRHLLEWRSTRSANYFS